MPRLSKALGQTKSLCRFWQGYFLSLTSGAISFFFGPVFFVFFTQGLFSAFDFSIRVSIKSFHARGNFCQVHDDINKTMQIT